jgi:hypothetical protein
MSTRPESDVASDVDDTRPPRVLASAAYLWARLCLPAEVAVNLATTELTVRPRLVARETYASRLDDGGFSGEAVALDVAGRPGVLLVERGTALGLVNFVLGLSLPVLTGPLSRVERGVLEGTIATVLARLGLPGMVRLRGRAHQHPPTGSLALELSVRLRGESGSAWLIAGDDALEHLNTLTPARGPESAPWLELVSTRLPAREMACAEVGDQVVFDENPALSASMPWPARVLWRGNAAAVHWLTDGSVVAWEGAAEPPTAAIPTRPERVAAARNGDSAGRAQDAWVEIHAGTACPSLVGAGPRPLVIPRAQPILLKADGEDWAYGNITEYHGEFAAMIARKTSR